MTKSRKGIIPSAIAVLRIAAASFLVFVVGYKKARILDYIAAVLDPLKGSYKSSQAELTLSSGGILGVANTATGSGSGGKHSAVGVSNPRS